MTARTPRLAAKLAAIARSTPMDDPPRGDLDDWIEGRIPRRKLSQEQIDALPRDRRERDGEAFDIAPPRFGQMLMLGGDERSHPRDRAEIVGEVIGAAFVVGVALFLAWFASRQLGGVGWT
jgi:hypothetical protein